MHRETETQNVPARRKWTKLTNRWLKSPEVSWSEACFNALHVKKWGRSCFCWNCVLVAVLFGKQYHMVNFPLLIVLLYFPSLWNQTKLATRYYSIQCQKDHWQKNKKFANIHTILYLQNQSRSISISTKQTRTTMTAYFLSLHQMVIAQFVLCLCH